MMPLLFGNIYLYAELYGLHPPIILVISCVQIASYVNKSAMDTAVLQRSLAILESMVLNSQDLYHKVAQEITIGQLIPHLQGQVSLLYKYSPYIFTFIKYILTK